MSTSHGKNQPVGGHDRIQGNQVEIRRRIEQDKIERLRHRRQRPSQRAVRLALERLGIQAGIARGDEEALRRGGHNDAFELALLDGIGNGQKLLPAVIAQRGTKAGGDGGLGVEIHNQHLVSLSGKPGPEIQGGDGLAAAALLVRHADGLHMFSMQ